MSKKLTLLLTVFISIYLTGCSAAQNYLYDNLPIYLNPSTTVHTAPALEYDFIHPRYSELPQATATKLDEISYNQNQFTYYSASGHRCYTLSLNPLQSACNIDGQWIALARILNSNDE